MSSVAEALLFVAVISVGVVAIRNSRRTATLKRRVRDHAYEIERLEGTLLAFQRANRARELRARHTSPVLEPKLLAGRGEDLLLLDLFEGESPGTFLECGAYDGVRHSCTYTLAQLGWTGVLIEAIPEFADNARRHRKESVVIESAVSRRGSTGTADFTILPNTRIGGDTASFLSNDAAHQRSWRQQIKDGTRIQVRVRDMDSLLAESGVECIDIAVLDVEGAESDVLDGFDLARWGVRCLVIEDLSRGRNRVLRVSLGEQGYDHAMRIGLNDVFVKRGDAIAQRAHVLCGQP